MRNWILPVALSVLSTSTYALELRLTKGQAAGSLSDLLAKVAETSQTPFTEQDFVNVEERDLANTHFLTYVQTAAGVPVGGTAVRIWTDLKTKELIQAELHLDEKTHGEKERLVEKFAKAKFSGGALKSKALNTYIQSLVNKVVRESGTDTKILSMKSRDEWQKGDLVRVVQVRAGHGLHTVTVSLLQNKIVGQSYKEFPFVDQISEYQTLEANVFPIYEEVESTNEILPFVRGQLKYVYPTTARVEGDPYADLKKRKYLDSNYSPVLSQIPEGRRAGYWSAEMLRAQADKIADSYSKTENSFANGLLLQGKYVKINLHPDAKNFTGLNFELKPSLGYMLKWAETDGHYEAIPENGFFGKTISSQEELLSRIPVRLADNDPVGYINSGADEVQVYYAVTTLMDALNEMGLTDPEYSTKAFEAFLYDPDISYKDNAYYTDNTINFTTYGPKSGNAARDNSTIWHELGHGIMDRLMGPMITLADTGGLSEGMADFVAMLVVQHQTNNAPFPGKEDFRIINQTGFYLTNEVHDDGEAYGGTMRDILESLMSAQGRQGLFEMADLTMETMRLTRNHPALTAQEWFKHMLYADELGSSFRAPGAHKNQIIEALGMRNFSFDPNFKYAKLTIMNGASEVTSSSAGSREQAITACDVSGSAHYELKVKLTDGDAAKFAFPVQLRVGFKKHALQGAIRWAQEDQDLAYTVESQDQITTIPLDASMKCDYVNEPTGTCKDYAYLEVFNPGEKQARAKKRFYLRVKDGATECKASDEEKQK